MNTAGNKDVNVSTLIDGARKIRESLDGLYKDLLKLGRKVKYLEPVGPAVAAAINEMIEAEMAVKAVVDAGNEWTRIRGASKTADYVDQGVEYEYLDSLGKATGGSVSTRDGWFYRKRGGSVAFQVQKPSYRPPDVGHIRELVLEIDTSLLDRAGTIVVEPVWEVLDFIDLDNWTKAARMVNQAEKLSKVVGKAFDDLEKEHKIQVPDWIRRHMGKYVMKRAWPLLTDGMSLRKYRYDLSTG